nr:restriction endonuclease subunit S [Neptunomonas qingdaonensis]
MTLARAALDIRFPKFADDWLPETIENLAHVTSGGTPNRSNKGYWGGDIPWVTTSKIDFNEIEEADEFITQEGLGNSSAKLFKRDTLLIALYGQGVTRGKVAILKKPAATNQACAAVSFDAERVLVKFAFYYLQRNYEAIRNIANDGGQKNLSGGLVKAIKLHVPRNLEEQQKIADFLSAVDKKISLLKQKNALLQQYKKGVMQQLFSRQIRFKDDNGNDFPDWQEYRLNGVLVLQENSLNMLDNEEYELITVKRRNAGVVSRGVFKGKEVLVKNQFILKKNQFVISKRQIVHGACGMVPESLDGAIVSNEYNVFEANNEKLDIHYFNLLATTLDMKKAFFRNSDGVHIEKLLFKTKGWLKTKMLFPCVDEQRKILKFVKALDNKIELAAQQIELTQTFKKGLLQQMFV